MLGTTPERLVRLDPFWLDRDELSVGEARARGASDQAPDRSDRRV
jgi:hypothetical protein